MGKALIEENPYRALELNPKDSLAEITAELQDRALAMHPEERAYLQGAWQRVAQNGVERALYALCTRPRWEERTVPARVTETPGAAADAPWHWQEADALLPDGAEARARHPAEWPDEGAHDGCDSSEEGP